MHDTVFYDATGITEEKEGMNNHHFKKHIMPYFRTLPKLTQLLLTVLEMQYTSDTELLEHLEKLVLTLGSEFNGDISEWDVSNVTDMN